MKALGVLTLFVILSLNVQAQDLGFDALSQAEVDAITKDFSAMFMHTSVGPASSLGEVFGVELGLYAGLVKTPNIETLTTGTDAIDQLPHLGLLFGMSFPMGISGELNYLPSFDQSGTKFSLTSLGGKWTLPDDMNPLPMTFAVRAFYTKLNIEFSAPTAGGTAAFKFDNSITGLQALISQKFAIFEPYFGLGYVSGSLGLDVTGSSTVLPFTVTQSASSSPSAIQYFLGAEMEVLFFAVGLEFNHTFDSDRITLKSTFRF